MRKVLIGLFLLALDLQLAVAQEDPMDSFMGIKWGAPMAQAQMGFMYADKIKIWPPNRWILRDFDFGKLKLTFIFNFDKSSCLTQVVTLNVTPDDFLYLVDILTEKYGQPKSKSEEAACWWNETRTILLLKYFYEKTNIGLLNFSPGPNLLK